MACRAEGNFGRPFKAGRGVTQGGPLSPKLFNILVDAIVREWLRQLFGDDAAMHGLGTDDRLVRLFVALFYADDGYLASRDPALLQEAIDILVPLFERVGLRCNTTKTEAMICVPGRIRTRLSTASYLQRFGYANEGEWDKRRVVCDRCDAELSAASLRGHLATQHGVFQA